MNTPYISPIKGGSGEEVDLSAITTDIEITDSSKGVILINSDGSRYRLTIDTDSNYGAIIITKL